MALVTAILPDGSRIPVEKWAYTAYREGRLGDEVLVRVFRSAVEIRDGFGWPRLQESKERPTLRASFPRRPGEAGSASAKPLPGAVPPHEHEAARTGDLYEWCECGAVRRKAVLNHPAEEWHACDACSRPTLYWNVHTYSGETEWTYSFDREAMSERSTSARVGVWYGSPYAFDRFEAYIRGLLGPHVILSEVRS